MRQYVVDAFTSRVFSGNPAAVCVTDKWPDEELMRNIAKENNFSETAFAVKDGDAYRLRWFTPGGEIDLCGHATLATACVILRFYEPDWDSVIFETLGGALRVKRDGNLYEMDFPAYEYKAVPVTESMTAALGVRPAEAYLSRDLLMVLNSGEVLKSLTPDMERLKKLEGVLAIVTAQGRNYDCVSRVFAPKLRIPEDPVTGSAHCMIAPYWTEKLGKRIISAFQASERTGKLVCSVEGDRVLIKGSAAVYSSAELFV